MDDTKGTTEILPFLSLKIPTLKKYLNSKEIYSLDETLMGTLNSSPFRS